MRKSILKLIMTLGLTIYLNSIFSQDLLLFQYDNLPIILNPALTGNDQENLRISANLRNQPSNLLSNASYKSGFLAIDFRKELKDNNYFGFGLIAVDERAGSSNFGTNSLKPTISFNKVISNSVKSKTIISIGSALGAARISIDENFNFPTPEPNLNFKRLYFDISFGLDLNYKIFNRLNLDVGLSLNHVNKPNISLFTNGIQNLNRSINLYSIAEIKINKSYSVLPNILIFNQVPYGFEIYGFKNRFYLEENKIQYLQLGLQYLPSSGKTIVINAEIKISQFLISISFGKSYSEFNWAQDHTYEFGISYYLKKKKSTN